MFRERSRERIPGSAWPPGIACAVGCWMLSQRKTELGIGLFGLTLGIMIPFFREIESTRVAASAKLVARSSYGIYLVHFPIMLYVLSSPRQLHPAFRHIPLMPLMRHYARPIDAFLVTVLTCGAAWILFQAVEKPGIWLGRQLCDERWGQNLGRRGL